WVSGARAPAGRQARVVLLAFAQQQATIGEPVTRLDPPFDVLLPLLIQVDTALLDRATGLALRFGEPGPDERIHEREGVLVVDRRRGNLLRERLQRAAARAG